MAQVGLVGLPNAGKSTLLNAICRTRSRVAAYPFTTLHPILGTIHTIQGDRIILADIPGLIEGAHEGAGLGSRFLRHIERTELLLYVLDVSPEADPPPLDAFRRLVEEIRRHEPKILRRPRILALNKTDLLPDGSAPEEIVRELEAENEAFGGRYSIVEISAEEKRGTEQLLETIGEMHRGIERVMERTP
jgi:GTP-binding protein